ncbi:hypothetical protein SPI_09315 [Niveomyces insectorum RCEF 264]|uniref:Uncharacterized protein n=1 Tax=Niveomyces insectorum RCEF 264 TaxID=1081102 RepID=A0A162K5H6_9HYPO|nr:hypothetical protein SPI_09315 [Niveomyces insectorum RCEF 264]
MAPPAASEGDPVTAIRFLFQLVDPHMKTLALLALLSGPLGIFRSMQGFPLSLATSPTLLGAAFLLLKGFNRPADVRGDAADRNARAGEAEGGGDDGAERENAASDPLGGYLKTGLIAYIVFQACRPYITSLPLPPTIPSWAAWALPAAAVAVALCAPTTKLYGPARFAYLECFRAIFPPLAHRDGWLYPVLLLAFGPGLLSEAAAGIGSADGHSLALGGTIVLALWTYAHHAYDAQLRAIAEDVGHQTSVANVAQAAAREYAAAVVSYEGHLLNRGLVREDLPVSIARVGKKPAAASSATVPEATFTAALAAQETARLAEKAVSTARNGDMVGARQHAVAAKAAANETLALMETARQEMLQAKNLMRNALGK